MEETVSGAASADSPAVFRFDRSAFVALAVVLAVALILRLGFALLVCGQLSPGDFRNVHGDTNGYLKLGRNIAEHKDYAPAAPTSAKNAELIARDRLRALARPPGYPLFLAIHQWCGVDLSNDVRPIVWTQAICSALLAGIVFVLGCWMFGHLSGGWIAGLCAAFSPTAIAAASLATPDSLFAVSATAGFAAFIGVASRARSPRARIGCAIVCGLMYAIAVALKPAIMYWPVIAVPALLAMRGFRWAAARDAAIAFVPMLLVVVLWSDANARREGVRTYSTIGMKNVSSDVVARARLMSDLGRKPLEPEFKAAVRLREAADAKLFKSPTFDIRAYCQNFTTESRAGLREVPKAMLSTLWSNFCEQVSDGWYWLDEQLPAEFAGSRLIRWVYDYTDHRNPRVFWWTCVIVAIPLCAISRDQRALRPLIICGLAFLYIAMGTATTHGEGSRLMMAAEPMELLLISGTLCHAVALILRWFARPASPSHPAAT